ncbi:response regulator [Paenibacillus mesophilus]|uniref:response regulator n=1 Tax=Paenibacillus mesophilus TaxID=2582849 RepID=UPI00110EA4EF|nr:response regulator [Paenibacillus mesophilus]TMV52142.1 response regulator [Paenibacillus mesophilus]
MKVIVVDDERLALMKLTKMLQGMEDCEVVGCFLSAEQAVEQIGLLKPDVVFLDIHMPGLNGLQAIERMRAIVPDLEVVLVTGHGEYALTAFGLDVLDYVLKPVGAERLKSTVQRLRRRIVSGPANSPPQQETAFIRCLGMLQFQKADGQPAALRWRTAKIKELFAYMLHRRNNRVSMDSLLELLWPELDEQKGRMNLHTGIYQLRRILKEFVDEPLISIRYANSGYTLETKQVRIDAEEWERQLRELPPVSLKQLAGHQQLFDQYRGTYFGEDRYSWAELERQRLKALWMQHAERLGQFYGDHGMNTQAISVYNRMQQLDPLLEHSYIGLMNVFALLKDMDSVEAQFNLAVRVLNEEAGAGPGPEITACYRRLKDMDTAIS